MIDNLYEIKDYAKTKGIYPPTHAEIVKHFTGLEIDDIENEDWEGILIGILGYKPFKPSNYVDLDSYLNEGKDWNESRKYDADIIEWNYKAKEIAEYRDKLYDNYLKKLEELRNSK